MPVKKRGNPVGLVLGDQWRKKIQVGVIITRLNQHVKNEIKMLPTQVAAAKILLDKCLPNLSHLDVAATVDKTVVVNVVSFADLKYDEEGNPIYGKADGESPHQTAH